MNIVKKVSLLAILFWSLAVVSCFECPEITGRYFDVKGMSLTEYRLNGTPVRTGEDVTFDQLLLLMQFNVQYYAMEPTIGGLINPSFAADCPQNGELGSKEILKNIVVQTINDFNDDYKAGDTINDLMGTQVFGLNVPLGAFLARDSMRVNYEGFGLTLKQKPTKNPSKFRVTLTLTNGEKYTKESAAMTVN